MSDSDTPTGAVDSKADLEPITCAGGCPQHNILRAIFYTPVVLLVGSMAVLATYPEFAEYATPFIGEHYEESCCAGSGLAAASKMSGGHCCSSEGNKSSRMLASNLNGCHACPASDSGCCVTGAAQVSAEEPIHVELEAMKSETIDEHAPADATAAVNFVELEKPSN